VKSKAFYYTAFQRVFSLVRVAFVLAVNEVSDFVKYTAAVQALA